MHRPAAPVGGFQNLSTSTIEPMQASELRMSVNS
jgi:hypothetical protein